MTNGLTLIQVLRTGRQADPDGVEVRISRQAVEEAANEIEHLHSALMFVNAQVRSPSPDWNAVLRRLDEVGCPIHGLSKSPLACEHCERLSAASAHEPRVDPVDKCLVAGCGKPALVTPDGAVGGLCEEHNGRVGLKSSPDLSQCGCVTCVSERADRQRSTERTTGDAT